MKFGCELWKKGTRITICFLAQGLSGRSYHFPKGKDWEEQLYGVGVEINVCGQSEIKVVSELY